MSAVQQRRGQRPNEKPPSLIGCVAPGWHPMGLCTLARNLGSSVQSESKAWSVGLGVQGLEVAVQGCKGARVPGCKGARVQGCKGARVQGCKGARVQGCKGARVQGCKGVRV